MTAIGPPPSPLAPPPGGPITAVVAEADAAIARLAAGTILAAQVVGRDAAGLLLLRTERGSLSVRTVLSPPPGATVLVEIQNVGNHISAVILAVRKPAADPALPQAPSPSFAPARIDAPAPRDVPEVATSSVRPGAVFVARILPAAAADQATRASEPAAFTPPNSAPAPTGAPRSAPLSAPNVAGIRLTLRTIAVSEGPAPAPASAPSIATEPAVPASVPASAPSAASGAPAVSIASRPIAVPLSPATQAPGGFAPSGEPAAAQPSARIAGTSPLAAYLANPPGSPPVEPARPHPVFIAAPSLGEGLEPGPPSVLAAPKPVAPGTAPSPLAAPSPEPAAAPPPLAANVRFDAVVEGWMPPDRLVLGTPYGALVTRANHGPLPGTVVAFEVLEVVQPLPSGPAPGPAGSAWPALDRALHHLAEVEPAIARELAREVLPNAGGNAVAAVLAFLRAARARDPGGWVGGAALAALTSAGRGEAVGRLVAEFTENARAHADPTTDWRAVTVPFHDGERVQSFRLAYRRPRRDDERSRAAARRFLVTLETSRLGALQFDGLVLENRFELIIRSGATLAARHRDGMRAIFDDSCGVVGLNGRIAFAPGARFVDPLAAKTVRHAVDPFVA